MNIPANVTMNVIMIVVVTHISIVTVTHISTSPQGITLPQVSAAFGTPTARLAINLHPASVVPGFPLVPG